MPVYNIASRKPLSYEARRRPADGAVAMMNSPAL